MLIILLLKTKNIRFKLTNTDSIIHIRLINFKTIRAHTIPRTNNISTHASLARKRVLKTFVDVYLGTIIVCVKFRKTLL